MPEALQVIAAAWLGWAALCLLLTLAVPLVAPATTASTNGIWIVVPRAVRQALTQEELQAIVAHERGHRAKLHALENLLCACVFTRRSATRAAQQEFEADDWAAKRTDPLTLASALRKLSAHPFDLHRAIRLEQIAAGKAGSSVA